MKKALSTVKEFRLKLYPKDFTKMRSFYETVLGYPVLQEWNRGPKDKGVMFDLGEGILELQTSKKAYQAPVGVAVSLEVVDAKKLWEGVKDKSEVLHEPRHNAWGDTSFRIKDPEGFELTFFTKDPKETE